MPSPSQSLVPLAVFRSILAGAMVLCVCNLLFEVDRLLGASQRNIRSDFANFEVVVRYKSGVICVVCGCALTDLVALCKVIIRIHVLFEGRAVGFKAEEILGKLDQGK